MHTYHYTTLSLHWYSHHKANDVAMLYAIYLAQPSPFIVQYMCSESGLNTTLHSLEWYKLVLAYLLQQCDQNITVISLCNLLCFSGQEYIIWLLILIVASTNFKSPNF